jgi:hypothetical protein
MIADIIDMSATDRSIKQFFIINTTINFTLFLYYTIFLSLFEPLINSIYLYVIISDVISIFMVIFEIIHFTKIFSIEKTLSLNPNFIERWKELSSIKKDFYIRSIILIVNMSMFCAGEMLLWFNKLNDNFSYIEDTGIIATHLYLLHSCILFVYVLYSSKY